MARARMSIGDLAESLLRTVEAEKVVKTASSTYTSGEMKTDIGRLVKKLAEEVQTANHTVSYADLHEFRKRYAI